MQIMSKQEASSGPDESADPLDARLEELVSYLDGELDDTDADRLEQQLSADPPLRSYVETLDRTWRLLDSLEEAPASGEFTQRTLASLDAVSAEPDSTQALMSLSQFGRVFRSGPWLSVAGWTLAGFIGTSVGLLLARSAPPGRGELDERRLFNDLDLLQQYKTLRPVPDTEFLRQTAEALGRQENQQP